MPSNLAHRFDPEEVPTKKIENVPSRTLAALARIERLSLLAAERLSFDPDPDAILSALGDLSEIGDLARAVSR